jgi:hypothetical protein
MIKRQKEREKERNKERKKEGDSQRRVVSDTDTEKE